MEPHDSDRSMRPRGLRWCRYPFPTGRVYLFADEERLQHVHLGGALDESALREAGTCGPLDAAIAFLDAYLLGRPAPMPPLALASLSDSVRRIYAELMRIPFGGTVTYGELAIRAGIARGAARFVGTAMARNPLPIFIPCHRVIRADGSLGGFSAGVAVKRFLLQHERALAG
ncbi:MAG TPA: methylated-DNA--[protein]-cysteine S-methyltransferase [Spirochaetota bacterium]|nr:methylated-DNA--[protein]-cysteine S-methyltransferase [Spirochaetota bacterium]